MQKHDWAATIGSGVIIFGLLLIFATITALAWVAKFKLSHVVGLVLFGAAVVGGGGWLLNKMTTDGVTPSRSIVEQMDGR